MKPLSIIRARIANRADTEHEQALIRAVIGVVFFAYLLPDAIEHSVDWAFTSKAYLVVMTLFLIAALAIIGCILVRPRPAPARRVIANIIDVVTLSSIMIFGEERAASLFFIYLWVTFGFGFRYGANYLLISLALSSVGFVAVLSLSDYWAQNRSLGIGILVGMVLLSLYVLTLVRRLYDAIDRAEIANQAKRKFISSVSHELRTPLNAIIGMNDLLCKTTLNAEQSEMASTMHGASHVMLSLIEGVLDFSKIEAGKINIESADFDLRTVIQSTLTIFSREAAMKGLKLDVVIMPDVTPELRGDAHHLRQVLVNLIGNAVKFTEQGEVRLTVSVLSGGEQSVRLKFAVRDTGIGISQADQQRIFESFTQADSPGDRKHRGTGLGTTISKQLVELMGGTIGLESAAGAGSTFWFDLPFTTRDVATGENPAHLKTNRPLLVGSPDEARELHAAVPVEKTPAEVISLADYYQRREPTRSYRVLVADDDPINRKVIAMQLEAAGHCANLVADGEQALDALGEADYDVVILDSHMPVMNGLDAARMIRVMQAGRAGVPIIMFSADVTPETIQEAADAGINLFLPKPLEASRLYAALDQLAEKRPGETARPAPAITPPRPASGARLLNTVTLRELEHMSQDPEFMPHLVQLFGEDSSQLLLKIEETLSRQQHKEFKSHIHALKGSALNLGAERLFAHCTRIGALDPSTLDASAKSLAAETRAIITQTQAALADYVQNRSGVAGALPSPIAVSQPASQRRTNPQPRHLNSVDSASARSASSSADLSRRA